ncbi:MAG: SMP-30/gluconolactonase/LRE family protein [Gammaproteobacteria bacterium]
MELHEQEQPVQGVYRLSPDEKKLYIDDSKRRHIRVFYVGDDGSLSGGSLFHDMDVSIAGSPDGMKVDVQGHVYCTGPGGVWSLMQAADTWVPSSHLRSHRIAPGETTIGRACTLRLLALSIRLE